jgi:hypothetical protein
VNDNKRRISYKEMSSIYQSGDTSLYEMTSPDKYDQRECFTRGFSSMRCSNCGFPLSPSRKRCSRCGAEVTGKVEKRNNEAEELSTALQGSSGIQEGGPGLQQQQWGQAASATWDINGSVGNGGSATPPPYQGDQALQHEQLPFTSTATFAGQLSFPEPEAPSPASINPAPAAQQPLWLSAPPNSPPPLTNTPLPSSNWAPDMLASHAATFTTNPKPYGSHNSFLASKLTPRFGFTIAGAFILTGTLLLIFVFLISLSLPVSSISSSQKAAPTITTKAKDTPTASKTASPEATLSPTTGTFPGQQFIDNGQTASAVNTSTATATQVTSSFKVHQQIYVTFAVHASQNGTVCLAWFLNEKQFDGYNFAMSGVSTSAYSYTTASTPGTGYIQIYWATKPDCSDKTLAQQVNFIVTA